MRHESGFVLIVTIVIVCMITLAILVLMNRTVDGSYFAWRRADTVQAFSLAESAAMEGYWKLNQEPSFRGTYQRYWSDGWYQYVIIDNTPAGLDDLNLQIIGEGYTQTQTRKVRLHLQRPDLNTAFEIVRWEQLN